MVDPFAFLPGTLSAATPATVPKCAKGAVFPASYMENPDARYLGTGAAGEKDTTSTLKLVLGTVFLVGVGFLLISEYAPYASGVFATNPEPGIKPIGEALRGDRVEITFRKGYGRGSAVTVTGRVVQVKKDGTRTVEVYDEDEETEVWVDRKPR